MQLKTVPSESLREHGHHAVSVFLVLEQHHGVVREAHQGRTTAEPRTHFFGEPHVEHLVQEDDLAPIFRTGC
jgi:hypothetical protein